MSLFDYTHIVPVVVADLTPVAQLVAQRFEERGFSTHVTSVSSECQEIGVTQGGLFKAALGLKTALRLKIETVGGATRIDAGIGMLETQAIPAAVGMLIFWPALMTQSWGLVRQHKLDEEAVALIEAALRETSASAAHFCGQCGKPITEGSHFCPHCGKPVG